MDDNLHNSFSAIMVIGYIKFVVKRIIKLCRIQDIIYCVIHPFCKNIIECDYEKSMMLLDSVSTYSNGSCFRENEITASKYDLKIIVPAYNVSKYLQNCMDSILSQITTYNYKVVLVDDGSTDGTENIVNLYLNNPRVDVIHKRTRGGVSEARNIGLRILDSDYICFVDSDDKMAPGFIENFLKLIKENNADIAEGSCYSIIDNKVTFHHGYLSKNITKSHNSLTGFPWGKIYKSTLFKNSIFPEGFWYEDTCLRLNIFHHAKKILLVPNTAYYYRNNPNSLTAASTKRTARNLETVWVTKCLFDSRKALGVQLTSMYVEDLLNQFIVNYVRTSFFESRIRQAIFQIYVKMIDSIDTSGLMIRRHMALFNAIKNRDYGSYELYMKTH